MYRTILVILLINIIVSGCAFREELPIKADAYLERVSPKIKKKDADEQKGITQEASNVIYGEPPSFPQNATYRMISGTPEYIIGTRDYIEIIKWSGTNRELTETIVKADGTISYSFLANILVAGLTPTEVDNSMTSQLKDFVKDPRIDVVVKRYVNKTISLLGEVAVLQREQVSGPGVYGINGRISLLTQILESGGPTDEADLARVKVIREGKSYIINIAKQIQTAGTEVKEVYLDNNDIVVVPAYKRLEEQKIEAHKIYVFGEVVRPGILDLRGDINIVDAISSAGGFTVFANRNDLRIIRGPSESPIIFKSDMKRLLEEKDLTQLVPLKSGDIVFVASTGMGKVDQFAKKIGSLLDLLKEPAIFRDIYTTGGWGRLDTGPPITGVDGELGGEIPGGLDTTDLLIREGLGP